MVATAGNVRIGEFSRRVGVKAELLRAWERRYGLLRPTRSEGGFRLYSGEDEERVVRMRAGLESGLSAAEAARMALEPAAGEAGALAVARERLFAAIARYDEPAVHALLDDSLSSFGVEPVLRDLILPTLARLGEEWERGLIDVSQEHFGSHLIRGRLIALARLWGRGPGPLAILACVAGERHDVSLLAFGLVLRSYGWRIIFLGADTPTQTLVRTAAATSPAIAVVTCFDAGLLTGEVAALRRFGRTTPLALAGPGSTSALCARVGARRLNGDLVAAARDLGEG